MMFNPCSPCCSSIGCNVLLWGSDVYTAGTEYDSGIGTIAQSMSPGATVHKATRFTIPVKPDNFFGLKSFPLSNYNTIFIFNPTGVGIGVQSFGASLSGWLSVPGRRLIVTTQPEVNAFKPGGNAYQPVTPTSSVTFTNQLMQSIGSSMRADSLGGTGTIPTFAPFPSNPFAAANVNVGAKTIPSSSPLTTGVSWIWCSLSACAISGGFPLATGLTKPFGINTPMPVSNWVSSERPVNANSEIVLFGDTNIFRYSGFASHPITNQRFYERLVSNNPGTSSYKPCASGSLFYQLCASQVSEYLILSSPNTYIFAPFLQYAISGIPYWDYLSTNPWNNFYGGNAANSTFINWNGGQLCFGGGVTFNTGPDGSGGVFFSSTLTFCPIGYTGPLAINDVPSGMPFCKPINQSFSAWYFFGGFPGGSGFINWTISDPPPSSYWNLVVNGNQNNCVNNLPGENLSFANAAYFTGDLGIPHSIQYTTGGSAQLGPYTGTSCILPATGVDWIGTISSGVFGLQISDISVTGTYPTAYGASFPKYSFEVSPTPFNGTDNAQLGICGSVNYPLSKWPIGKSIGLNLINPVGGSILGNGSVLYNLRGACLPPCPSSYHPDILYGTISNYTPSIGITGGISNGSLLAMSGMNAVDFAGGGGCTYPFTKGFGGYEWHGPLYATGGKRYDISLAIDYSTFKLTETYNPAFFPGCGASTFTLNPTSYSCSPLNIMYSGVFLSSTLLQVTE